MEIQPASMAQFTKGRDGKLIEISDDVGGVARRLAAIDPHIRLRYSEAGAYWVVYWKPEEWEQGQGYLIFTAQELDQRIVKKMEEVYWRCRQDGYSLAESVEKEEAKAKREADHEWSEQHGEIFQKLAFAMRKDLGYDKASAFIADRQAA
jgi:hypothetical protein